MTAYRQVRAITILTLTLALGHLAHADTLLSENFNELTPQLSATTVGAFTTLNGTNVDIVGGNLYGGLCAGPESGNCVDLGGSGGNAFGQLALTTPLDLSAGAYTLSFDLIGSQRGNTTFTTVRFGGYTHTFTLAGNDLTSGVFSETVNLAGGPVQLEFANMSTTDANAGSLLDNVSITSGPNGGTNTTPEPQTWALLLTGTLGGFAVVRRHLMRKSLQPVL